MNKIFKVIWSKTKNSWIVTSEYSQSHHKKSVKTHIALAGLVLLGMMWVSESTIFAADNDQNVNTLTAQHINAGYSSTVSGDASAVIGGSTNTATGAYSAIIGGDSNNNNNDEGVIVSGQYNTISPNIGQGNTILGGHNNTISRGANDVLVGGYNNNLSADFNSVIVGGSGNTNDAAGGTVIGGYNNKTSRPNRGLNTYFFYSTSVGGSNSVVVGQYSTGVGGGSTGPLAVNATAVGYQSMAVSKNGLALGYQAVTDEDGTIAFGHNAGDVSSYELDNYNATSLNKVPEKKYSASYYNRLVKIADGKDDHDAVTMEQLNGETSNRETAETAINNKIGSLSADGKAIKASNTISENLSALDAAISSSSSAKVAAGTNINVTSSTDTAGVTTYTVSASSDGTIAKGNTSLLSGGTAYTELRPNDGTYVKAANTTADNLTALDKQTAANTTGISTNQSDIKNLEDGIGFTDKGNTYIKNLAQGAIKVTGTGAASVTSSTDSNGVQTYTVNVDKNGGVTANDTNLVTGGTVYSALNQAKSDLNTSITNVKNSVSTLSDNAVQYDTNSSKGKVTLAGAGGSAITNLKDAALTATSTDAVTGKQLYNEQQARSSEDTNLEGKINQNASDITTNKNNISAETSARTAADTNLSNSITAETTAREKAIGTLDQDGTYIHKADDISKNLTALDTQASANANAIKSETSVREAADNAINDKIGTFGEGAVNYISKTASISTNLTTLDSQAKKNADAISQETMNRENAIKDLSTTLTDKGLVMSDGTNTATNKLGSTVAVTGDSKNISSALTQDKDGNTTIQVSMSDNPNFTTVTTTGDVTVGGTTTTQNLAVNGTTDLKGDTTIDGDTTIKKNLTVDGYIKAKNLTLTDGTNLNNAVTYSDDTKTQVKLAGEGGTTITNLKDGSLSDTSTDAVNGKQLYAEQTARDSADKANNKAITQEVNDRQAAVTSEQTAREAADADINATIGTRVKGNYYNAEDTIAGSINKVDAQVKTNADAIAKETTDRTSEDTKLSDAIIKETNDRTAAIGTISKDGNYIKKGTDVSGNLTTLDQQVHTNEDNITANKTSITNLQNGKGFTDAGNTYIKSLSKDAVKVAAGDRVTVTSNTDELGNETYTISANNDGKVVAGDTNLVSGDTVNTSITNLKNELTGNIDTLSGNAVQYDSTDKGKVTLKGKGGTLLTGVKDGTISSDSTDAVNGSQLNTTNENLAQEITNRTNADTDIKTNVIGSIAKDGNYIKTGQTVYQNLSSLDNQVQGNTTAIDKEVVDRKAADQTINDTIGNRKAGNYYADTDTIADSIHKVDAQVKTNAGNITDNAMSISNLQNGEGFTAAGNTYIKNLSKDAVQVKAGDRITVNATEENGNKTYTISANNDGKVVAGDTNLVSGDTVNTSITKLKEELTGNISSLSGSAVQYDDDAKGTVTLKGADGTTITHLKDAALNDTSTDAVTGKQLFAEQTAREKADSDINGKIGTFGSDKVNYIDKTVSISTNLIKLDTQEKQNADDISTETTNREAAITKEEQARTAADTNLSNRIGTLSTNGNYIHKDDSVSENLTALDTQAKANETAIGDEVTNRESAITKEANDREAAIQKAADTESAAREKEDKALSGRIGTLSVDGTYVKTANNVSDNLSALDSQVKTNADSTAANKEAINKETTDRVNAINQEVKDRNTAISEAVSKEVNDRNTAISAETTARENADDALSKRIGTLDKGNYNYIDKDSNVSTNLSTLDRQSKTNADAISKETTDRETAILNLKDTLTGDLTDKGLVLSDGTNTATNKLGSTVTVKGDNKNVTTVLTPDENGNTTLQVSMSDTPNFTSVTTTGDVNVGGTTTTNGLTVNGATNLNGDTTIDGDTTIKKNLTVDGTLTLKDGTNLNNAVTYTDGTKTKVQLAGEGGTTVSGVKAGDITSDTSTDAVNGAQLKATNDQLAQEISNRTAADTDIKDNVIGSITDDGHYIKKGQTVYQNLTNLDNQAQTNKNAIDQEVKDRTDAIEEINQNVGNLSEGAVQYDKDSKGGWDTTKVTLGGKDGTVISNVKAGDISEKSMDAVNGAQLYNEQTARENADKAINDTIGTRKAGNYYEATDTIADSVNKVDTQVKTNADAIAKETQDRETAIDSISKNLTDTGLTMSDGTNTATNKLGSTVAVTGDGKNISTALTTDGNGNTTIKVSMSDTPTFTSVTTTGDVNVGGKTTTKDLTVTGETNLKGDTTIEGDTHITKNLTVDGNLKVKNLELTDGTNLNNAVTYTDDTKTKIQLAGKDGTTISGVKAGELSETSTDAVNGAQLKATNDQLAADEKAFNDRIGTVSNDKVYMKAKRSVYDNMAAIDEEVEKNDAAIQAEDSKESNDISKVETEKADRDAGNLNDADVSAWQKKLGNGKAAAGDTGLVNGGTLFQSIQDVQNSNPIQSNGRVITIGAQDTATTIDVHGPAGTGKVVTGVITDLSDPTSAANVDYVDAVADNLGRNMNSGFNRLNDRINRAAAGASALAALHPLDYDPDDKMNFAVGYGHYRNANAAAVGAFYYANPDVMVSVGASTGNGSPEVNAGVSFKLGHGSEYAGISKVELAKENAVIRKENASIRQENQSIKKEDAQIREENAEMKEEIAAMKQQLALINEKLGLQASKDDGQKADVTLSPTVQKSIVADAKGK